MLTMLGIVLIEISAPVLLSRRGLKSTANSESPLKWTEERFLGSAFSPLLEDFRYEPGV